MGRPKGSPNKTTKAMREMVLEAFHGVGGVEYLTRQAEAEPKAFMALCGKMIPNEVIGDLKLRATLEVVDLSDGSSGK